MSEIQLVCFLHASWINQPGYDFEFLHTVGPGGSPDENGETTLDALIMNGVTAAYSCCSTWLA